MIFAVCSNPDPNHLMRQNDTKAMSSSSGDADSDIADIPEETPGNGDADIKEAIDKAEYFYARGVQYLCRIPSA